MSGNQGESMLSIHIADSSHSKSKRSAGNDSRKVAKRARFDLSTQRTASSNPCDAPSLRHLFSFSKQTQESSNKVLESTNASKSPGSFFLLPNFATSTSSGEIPAGSDDARKSSDSSDPPSSEPNSLPDLDRGNSERKLKSSHDPTSRLNSTVANVHDVDTTMQTEDKVGMGEPTVEQTIPDILMNDDIILSSASRFCRDSSVDELDEEWNIENGLRDQMRLDFKLKRQNIMRGRKLGALRPES